MSKEVERLCKKNNWDKPCPEVCGEMCNLWLSEECLLTNDKDKTNESI